jgi:predicted thioredoxin/glutaredoxin
MDLEDYEKGRDCLKKICEIVEGQTIEIGANELLNEEIESLERFISSIRSRMLFWLREDVSDENKPLALECIQAHINNIFTTETAISLSVSLKDDNEMQDLKNRLAILKKKIINLPTEKVFESMEMSERLMENGKKE